MILHLFFLTLMEIWGINIFHLFLHLFFSGTIDLTNIFLRNVHLVTMKSHQLSPYIKDNYLFFIEYFALQLDIATQWTGGH